MQHINKLYETVSGHMKLDDTSITCLEGKSLTITQRPLCMFGLFHGRSEVKYLLENLEGISMTKPQAQSLGYVRAENHRQNG